MTMLVYLLTHAECVQDRNVEEAAFRIRGMVSVEESGSVQDRIHRRHPEMVLFRIRSNV